MKTIHGVIIDDLVLTGFRALWRPDAANTQYSLQLYSKETPKQVTEQRFENYLLVTVSNQYYWREVFQLSFTCSN